MDQKEIAKKAGTAAGNVIVNKSVISTAGLITILLIILKATDNIDISWLWCFAAYWLPIAIVLGFMGLIVIGAALIGIGILILDEYDKRH
jgi:uncharacterized integral membrane protein